MAKNNETTTKFKVDISDLKRGMQEAKRQISVTNSEFKSIASSMDDWSASTEGLKAKLSQLGSNLGNQKTILGSLVEQYEKTVAEQKRLIQEQGEGSIEAQKLSKTIDNLKIAINNQKAAINKTEREMQQWKTELDKVQGGSKQTRTALNTLTSTIEEQKEKLNQLKQDYTNVVLEQGKGSREARSLAKEIKDLSGELKENEAKLKDAESATDALGEKEKKGESAASGLSGGFTIMKGALASLVADGIRSAIDGLKEFVDLAVSSDSAFSKFQAQTGSSAEEMEGFKTAIEDVYKSNFGESLEDVGDKMAYVKQVTGEVDPTKLKELTMNAMTLEDTFGSDFNETIRGTNNLMQHFGIDAQEAFDLFAKGSQNGLDYTGELGDNIAEYGGNFEQAGYSAGEYFQLLENGAQGGAYNLDKVNDSINEVKNRLGDGTIKENIGMFSGSTKQAFKEWENGQGTMKTVIDSIVSDISNCTDEQEALNMAATAFGTMGEDANLSVVTSLTTLGDSYSNVKGTMEDMQNVRYGDVKSELEGLGRTIKMDMLEPLVEDLLPYVKDGVQWVVDNLPAIKEKLTPIVDGIKDIAEKVGTTLMPYVKDGIQWVQDNLPAVKEALQPVVDAVGDFITWIVDHKDEVIAGLAGIGAGLAAFEIVSTVEALVAALKGFSLAETAAAVATKVAAAAQWVLNAAMSANPIGIIIVLISALVAAFAVLWNNSEEFRQSWIDLWDGIKEAVGNVVDSIVTFFTETIPEKFNDFVTFIEGIGDNISQFFQDLPGNITGFLSDALDQAGQWVSNMVDQAGQMGSNFVDAVVEFFQNLPGTIGYWIGYALATVALWAVDMATKAQETAENFVNNVVQFIQELPGKVYTWITNTLEKVKKWKDDMVEKARETAESFVNKIIEFFTTLPEKVRTWLENTLEKVRAWKDDMVNKAKEAAQGFIDKVVETIKELPGKIKEWLDKAIEKLTTWVTDMGTKGKEAIAELISKVVEGAQEIPEKMKSIGKNIVDGVWKGIQNAKEQFKKNVNDFFGGMVQGAKDALGIKSPSRVMAKEVGKYIPSGIALGIKQNAGSALQSVKKLAAEMTEEAKAGLQGVDMGLAGTGHGNGGNGQQQGTTNNYYFYQTNNSPKPMSRLDLYRQTKNLLGYVGA